MLGTGSDNSITTRFSLVRLLTGKENKELFPTENIERKTIFKDQIVVAATTCKAPASDHHCLQPPRGKIETSKGDARVGDHQE